MQTHSDTILMRHIDFFDISKGLLDKVWYLLPTMSSIWLVIVMQIGRGAPQHDAQ
jgi:hypothetical protein